MFRSALVFITITIIASAEYHLPDIGYNSIDGETPSKDIYYTDFEKSVANNIWVLELNDEGLDALKLRAANEEDQADFEFYNAPMMEIYEKEHSVVKKDAPKLAKPAVMDKKNDTTNTVSKKDIFQYLNKFALYSSVEPDGYLSDSHENDDSAIALYFKGPFTSLTVKQGMRQWHYFIQPPSHLPAWFYEDLGSKAHEGIIAVPEDVANKFYPTLFRLLKVLLRYPL